MPLNRSKYETAEDAAKAAFDYIKRYCKDRFLSASIMSPAEAERHSDGSVRDWWSIFEDGPYDWAVHDSLAKSSAGGGLGIYYTSTKHWYCDTYWGFDLIFVDLSSEESPALPVKEDREY